MPSESSQFDYVTRHYTDPTTVRLAPSTLIVLDTYALVEGISRSELVRRLLSDGISARAKSKPSNRATTIDSSATGREHRVTIEIDVPNDSDPDELKQRVATRNAAVLAAQCECGAGLEEPVNPPPARQKASVSAARPVASGEQRRFGRVIPSVSLPTRRRAGKGRATITAIIRHEPDCRGAA